MSKLPALATNHDVIAIFGPLDDDKVLSIMSLQPTIEDLEHARLWMDADQDVFGPHVLVQGPVSDIVTLLTEDAEDEGHR